MAPPDLSKPGGWLKAFIEANTRANLVPSTYAADGAPNGLGIQLQAQRDTEHLIDFKEVPDGETVVVRLAGPAQWKLADLGQDTTVTMSDYVLPQRRAPSSLTLYATVAGNVELNLGSELFMLHADDTCPATLLLHNGKLLPDIGTASGLRVQIAGGEIGAGALASLDLLYSAKLALAKDADLHIGHLTVHGDGCLAVDGHHKILIDRITACHCHDPGEVLSITRASVQRDKRVETEISIGAMRGVSVESYPTVGLVVRENAIECKFIGSSTVRFAPYTTGSHLEFLESQHGQPHLSVGSGGVMYGISGSLILGRIAESQLFGGMDGYLIQDFIGGPSASGKGAGGLCNGAFLSGFRVPPGLEGRSLLNHLNDCHHLEPGTKELLGWDRAYFASRGTSPTNLRHDAELMRKLGELSREKGASGSARTKIGWCAQRLRHKTVTGKWEWLALSGYRLLGYGERPGPPLMTWVVGSLILAGVLAMTGPGSVDTVWDFLGLWLERAISPVGVVVGSGSGPEADAWLYLMRAILAVPLVVSALALRNYVRGGR